MLRSYCQDTPCYTGRVLEHHEHNIKNAVSILKIDGNALAHGAKGEP
jgi:hypothetical protein